MSDLLLCPPAKSRDPVASRGLDLLEDLLRESLVLAEDIDNLSTALLRLLAECDTLADLANLLVEFGALTEYQAERISAGTTFGMVLGNYRVLDRLGAGGMGVVFRAEHLRMRRQVAIKVL